MNRLSSEHWVLWNVIVCTQKPILRAGSSCGDASRSGAGAVSSGRGAGPGNSSNPSSMLSNTDREYCDRGAQQTT